jgi:Cyclic nucleotide-binding domain
LKNDRYDSARTPASESRKRQVCAGSAVGPTQLFHAAQPRHLKAGERLFAIGDVGDSCYRLDQGLLKVVASPRGEERIIAILGPGAIVGELAMIDGLPRSASVVALHDCVIRFVSREAPTRYCWQSWPPGCGKWMRPWRPQPS